MRRQVLIPLNAALAVGVLGVSGLLLSQATQDPAAPAEQNGSVLEIAESTVAVVSSAVTASSVVVLPSTVAVVAEPQVQQPAPRVQEVDEPAPVETIVEPVNPVTTTPAATAQPAPVEPWCFLDGHGWYSGSGEGCTPDSPHFVEYR